MPFNLLIFPLVGGYYICIKFRYLRYYQQRLDRQKLLFNSVIAGVFLLISTFIVRLIVEASFPGLTDRIYPFFPIQIPYFGTTAVTFVFAILGTEFVNLFISREKAIKRAIKLIGNEFELMLKHSFDSKRLLQVTLKNDKFYIGWVKELPLPSHSNYIRIIPAFSGYRDGEKSLIFTTEYLEVYSLYMREGKIQDVRDLRTDLVIKIDEIITVNNFDHEMYERFNNVKSRSVSESK